MTQEAVTLQETLEAVTQQRDQLRSRLLHLQAEHHQLLGAAKRVVREWPHRDPYPPSVYHLGRLSGDIA